MKILKTAIFLFFLCLFFFSFYQVFSVSQNLYFIKSMEKEIEKLKKEIKNLEIELSQSSSLSNLDEFLAGSNLKKAERVKFIEVFSSGVVSK